MKINGEMHYLWRAVDHEGEAVALKFMKKALDRWITKDNRGRSVLGWVA